MLRGGAGHQPRRPALPVAAVRRGGRLLCQFLGARRADARHARVADPAGKGSGEAVDLRTGLLRFASGLLTVASCGVGLLWLWVDRDALTWHDRLAGTRVIVLPAKAA